MRFAKLLALLLTLLLGASPVHAGRDCDGVADLVDFGSDATIDNFTTMTFAFWMVQNSATANVLLSKDRDTAWELRQFGGPARYRHQWTTTAGMWLGSTTIVVGTLYHVVVTYDGGATTNDAAITVNGTAEGITETSTPAGTLTTDDTRSLTLCARGTPGLWTDTTMQNIAYDNAIWTADQANRHRWWGRIGSGVEVVHPLHTTKLANEGSAVANGTPTGTTMVGIPRVQRPGLPMMGMIGH